MNEADVHLMVSMTTSAWQKMRQNRSLLCRSGVFSREAFVCARAYVHTLVQL